MRLALFALAGFSLFGSGSDSFNFDRVRPGTLPAGWSALAPRPGEPSRWEIRADSSAPSRPNVLAQISAGPGETESAVAVFEGLASLNGDLSVKFKIQGGPQGTRTAGLVWRYQDPGNYYLLRFSVDEKNIILFRVINGQAQMVSAGTGTHDLRTGQWYVAKVVYRGDRTRVLFGNRLLFSASDNAILKPGKTGLRTRAGATVYFDDFRIDRKG